MRTPFPTPAPFQPRRWLRNGHLQTVVGNFLPRHDRLAAPVTELVAVPLPTEMQLLPEAVALDRLLPSKVLCHCHWQPGNRNAVTVVLVHGLEGSSYSSYVIGNANHLYAAGCNVVRMNMRTCGGTEALSPSFYHSGMSGDVLAILDALIRRGHGQIVLAGYSMGGNLVLKAVGELGGNAPPELLGAVAVSPPMDLRESADALHLLQNRIYEQRFLRNLLRRNRRKARLYPTVFTTQNAGQVRSIRDFDEHLMTPHCGFASANDYYARAGSSRVLDRIAVPTLVLHAQDDPFIRLTPETRAKLQANSHITLLEPEHGGHCAFLENPTEDYDGRWAEQVLLRFVQHLPATTPHTEQPVAAC